MLLPEAFKKQFKVTCVREEIYLTIRQIFYPLPEIEKL